MDEVAEEWDNCCPLCMEEMDSTDRQLKPCCCGYQICVYCWNHIMEMAEKDSSEGRCPACRTPYDKERIVSTTVNCERSVDMNEKKPKPGKAKSKAPEGRKNLSNVRVIQRNLVYVVGLPGNLADEETLERKDYFGQYGKILKISVSKPAGHVSQHSSSAGTSVSVYVTFVKEEDALRCIQAVNGYALEGKILKACFGTTKYCNAWLKHMPCNNPDCLYLHDEGTREDSFTKEEMIAKYGSKNQHFHDLTHPPQRRSGVVLPPPMDASPSTSTSLSHAQAIPGNAAKPSPPLPTFPKSSSLPAAASWGSRPNPPSVRTPQGRIGTGSTVSKVKTGTGATTAVLATSTAVASTTCTSKHPVQTNISAGVNCVKYDYRDAYHTSSGASATSAIPAASPPYMLVTSQAERIALTVNSQTASCTDGFDRLEGQVNWASPHSRHSSADESINLDPSTRGWEEPKTDGQFSSNSELKLVNAHGNDDLMEEHLGGPPSPEDKHGAVISDEMQKFEVDSQSNAPVTNDRSLSNGQASAAEESVVGDCTCESQIQTSDLQDVARMQEDAVCSFANTYDSMLPASLSVGGLSIHLNAEAPSSVISVSTENGITRSHTPTEEPLPRAPSDFALESFEKTMGTEQLVLATNLRGKQLEQGSPHIRSVSATGDSNGYWVSEREQTKEGQDEHEIISDMFSEGFDIWTDGSPQDWAQLLFNGKHADVASPSVSKDVPSTRKSSSSRQSRFQFARQEEAVEKALPEQRLVSQKIGHNKAVEGFNLLTCSNLPEGSGGFPSPVGDKNMNKISCTATSSDPFVLPPASNLRSTISTPPGFSNARASTVPPPGFSLHKPPDARKTLELGQDPTRFLAAPSVYNPLEATNANDVEFFDPAIMAVGRGKLPSGMRQTTSMPATPLPGLYTKPSTLATTLPQQSRSPDFELGYQMHPRHSYGSFGGMNPISQLGLTNQELADSSLPSLFQSSYNSEVMSPPRFLGQYRDPMGTCLPHLQVQDPVYNNGISKSRFQQSAWDEWNRLANSEANLTGQRLVNDAVGHIGMSPMSLDRLLQTRLEELALGKELGPKYYGDAVASEHDEQGPFSKSRMGRFFLQN